MPNKIRCFFKEGGNSLKDITAILVHYVDQVALHKALNSLKRISTRLKSTLVFQYQGIPTNSDCKCDRFNQINFIKSDQTLNDIINRVVTPYVLFLYDTDYLSATIHVNSLQIPHPKTVLGSFYHNRNIVIHRPFLVSTTFLKKEKFLSNIQLPFKEALFPAWLTNIEDSLQLVKGELVRQSRKNSSSNIIEKEKFIQKYQLKKVKTEHPTMSVLISNYNMGEYVETAIVSCLLQNEQFEQILVIDDGSTDNSYTQLQQWHDRKQVKVFNKENEGKAIALNQLLPYVTSEFILELDADDWLDSDAVSVIKSYLGGLPRDASVLYGNFRKWKQSSNDVIFKGVAKGVEINGMNDLLAYHFPLGPRIYRTSTLREKGGFPVIEFEDGRMYEDVSVLIRLIEKSQFCYQDFTVYNVREHNESITRRNDLSWGDFLKAQNLK